jgi:hypothetical protein
VVFLDNDFRDPDTDRYLDAFARYDPAVAVLGDAYTREDARGLNHIGHQLLDEHPHKTVIVVPKCWEAFDVLDEDIVLGYPNGYSDLGPEDFSERSDWRGRKVHVLGGSPDSQYAAIQDLTRPTVDGQPPADITGVDWNGAHKGALYGEYWTPDGWQPADHLSISETVRTSLEEVKRFWQDQDMWPDTAPRDLYGPAVREPDDAIFMDQGGDPIGSREELEAAYIGEYRDAGTLAFTSRSAKRFHEYRGDLAPVEAVE